MFFFLNFSVPDGSAACDELFSVAIDHAHSKCIYSLVYVPIINQSANALRQQMLTMDEYMEYDGYRNELFVYTSEIELLKATMQLITIPNKLYYLVGYNSCSYDIKFLLMRCRYFNLTEEVQKFLWNEGYRYGANSIHIDVMRISRMLFKLPKYTLDAVSKHVMKECKADVDAVALRYTFHAMRKYNRLFPHGGLQPNGKEITYPSLRDAIHYNNVDTLLVTRLVMATKCITFFIGFANECGVSLSNMNGKFAQMQFKVINECFMVGLESGCFLCTFHHTTPTVHLPILINVEDNESTTKNVQQRDLYEQVLNLEDRLHNDSAIETKKYPGGANFCLGEFIVKNVQSYDYRIAYPLLIERANLSDETSTVYPANYLYNVYDFINCPSDYITYDYLSHSENTATKNKTLFYQYINEGLYAGGEFPFNKTELYRRQNSLVIVILIAHKHRGVLSTIIAKFNEKREYFKAQRKQYESLMGEIENKQTTMELLLNDNEIEMSRPTVDPVDDVEGSDASDFGDSTNESIDCVSNASNNNTEEDEASDFGDCSDTEITDCNEVNTVSHISNNSDILYTYDNDLLIIYTNGACIYNDTKLHALSNPIDTLRTIHHELALKYNYYSDLYQLSKTRISSIYGCIGKLNVPLAALITCMIRTMLINSAHYLTREHQCKVYYCDTDSIFLTNPVNPKLDLSYVLNQRYPLTEIEMKMIENCIFVQKKTYYYMIDDTLKYGQNKNGPPIWRTMVDFFVRRTEISNLKQIEIAFVDFFKFAYSKRSQIDLFTQDIKLRSEHKTNTPSKELHDYLRLHYPALAGSFKQRVFYYMKDDAVWDTIYRPFCELRENSFDRVNLFKFFDNMFKTVFNILKAHLRRNNEPHNINLTETSIRYMVYNKYLDVYNETFGKRINSGVVLESNALVHFDFVDEDDVNLLCN